MDLKEIRHLCNIADAKRKWLEERHVLLFVPVPVRSVWMIIVLSASCLICPSFNRNVFLAEMIIWPNTHVIFCQPYELLLKFSLTLCLLLLLLTPLPVWDNIVKLRGLLSKQLLFAFNVIKHVAVLLQKVKNLFSSSKTW